MPLVNEILYFAYQQVQTTENYKFQTPVMKCNLSKLKKYYTFLIILIVFPRTCKIMESLSKAFSETT